MRRLLTWVSGAVSAAGVRHFRHGASRCAGKSPGQQTADVFSGGRHAAGPRWLRIDGVPEMPALTVFVWGPQEADANASRYGVGFDVATSAMLDPGVFVASTEDPVDDGRFMLIGMSVRHGALVVCLCCREDAHGVRILAARYASAAEAAQFHRRRPLPDFFAEYATCAQSM